jgi:UPF0271 protein
VSAVALEAFGDAAWRAPLPAGADGRALLDALRGLPRVRDAVVSERHVLVAFDPAAPPLVADVSACVARAGASAGAPAGTPREHVVAVRYDGPDVAAVAAMAGVSPGDVAAMHAAGTYVVAAIGFVPGFAYLRGLDPRLAVARRATPRPRVPALSVAVAGPYSGIYPFASAGGWHLLGTATDFVPFDARSGARLALGDRVRFAVEA